MKVLIDARFLNLKNAGLGRMSFELIKEINRQNLIANGNQYVLLVPKDRPDLSFLRPNFKIIETDIAHYSWQEQTKLANIIQKEKPDLVHFLHFNHPINYKSKKIINILDLTLSSFPASHGSLVKKIAYQVMLKHAVKSADKIVTISETVKKQLIEKHKVDPQKIEVVYLGYDSKFRPSPHSKNVIPTEVAMATEWRNPSPKLRDPSAIARDDIYLLYVGQIRPHKNVFRLVEAFKILQKDYLDLKLIIVGRGKIRLAKPKNVIFKGFVDDGELVELYQNASVFVLPSLSEGFGLPLVEAMAAGAPVACSDISVLKEVGGDAPIYFDPYDVRDIAAKIKDVLDDGKLREIMGHKGIKQAANFSWQICAEKILEIYEKLNDKDSRFRGNDT